MGNQAALVKYITESLDGKHGDLIAEVANVHDRQLYVGTVDAQTGQMTRIDMTALARGFGPDQREARDRCYVAAIVASAAIPIEFRQVTVDGKVFMDGGVRQSAFVADEVTRNLASNNEFDHVFLVMNENLTLSDTPDLTPSILNEVPYTIRAFIDQIQQALVHNISDYAQASGATGFYIKTDDASKKCSVVKIHNKFFDPNFMRCLIKQGLDADAEKTWLPL